MKKIILSALFLAVVLSLFVSCSKAETESEDSTLPVTSPQGFEDVTAPPEETRETAPLIETEETTDETSTDAVSSMEEALALAKAYLGETDPDTGYKYSFSYDGMLSDNGIEYFKIRVSWFIEEQERYSYCGDLLIAPDKTVSKFNW